MVPFCFNIRCTALVRDIAPTFEGRNRNTDQEHFKKLV